MCTSTPERLPAASAEGNVAEWHGKTIVDRDDEKIGKLQDVYVDESALYHHYELNYTPPDTGSGRRLARR